MTKPKAFSINFNETFDRIIEIKSACKECMSLLPDTLLNIMNTSQLNELFDMLLDKSLTIEGSYDALANVLFYSAIPSMMLSEKVYKKSIGKKDFITYTNKSMTSSLLNNHIEFYDENGYYVGNYVLKDLEDHIYTKVKYLRLIKKTTSSTEAYNYLYKCVKNKLCDMIVQAEKENIFVPIEQPITTNNGKTAIQEYATSENIEATICDPEVLKTAKQELIHQVISILSSHPDRLLAYLNTVVGNSATDLLESIKKNGYQGALALIINKAEKIDINIAYLSHKEFKFKKDPNSLTRAHIDTWINRFRTDKKFRTAVENFKKVYI